MRPAAPFVHDTDGAEHALGPLEAALVRAVLGAALRMRREPSYQIHLHVKHATVVVQVVHHLGGVGYLPPD